MPKPWEEYQTQAPQAEKGPWSEYQKQAIDYAKPAEPSNLQKLGTGVKDFTAGIGAGAISTGVGAYDLARKVPGVKRVLPEPSPAVRQATQAPPSFAGQAGKAVEQTAEFFAPAGLINRGAKAIHGMRAAPAINTLGRAALEGVSAAGVTGVQTGGDTRQMRNAGLTAGGLSAAVPAIAAGVRKVAPAILGKTTGAGEESIRVATSNPTPAFKNALRGRTSETDIVSNFRGAVGNAQQVRSADYTHKLGQISQQNVPPIDLAPVRQDLAQRLNAFRVRTLPNGELDFSRSVVPLDEEAIVRNIVNDVNSWDDLTPLGVDALKRRISNLYSHNSDVRALTQGVKDSTRSVLNASVPGYAEMTKGYETASRFLNEVIPEFSLGPTAKTGTVVRKISYALKQNNEYRTMMTEALDQFTNSDLKGQLAGYHLRDTLPKGITGVGTGLGILSAVASGSLTPAAGVAIMASSPRLVGETLAAMAKLRGAGAAASAAAPKIAASATVDRQGPPKLARGGVAVPKAKRKGHWYGKPTAAMKLKNKLPKMPRVEQDGPPPFPQERS